MVLNAWFCGGGGIDAELKREKPDGDCMDCCGSNFIGGSDVIAAMEGCVLAGGGL